MVVGQLKEEIILKTHSLSQCNATARSPIILLVAHSCLVKLVFQSLDVLFHLPERERSQYNEKH